MGDRTGGIRPCLPLFLGRAPVGRRAAAAQPRRVGRCGGVLSRAFAQSLRLRTDRPRHRDGRGLRHLGHRQVRRHARCGEHAQSRIRAVDVRHAGGRRRLPRAGRRGVEGDRHLVGAPSRRLRLDLRGGQQVQRRGDLRAEQQPDREAHGRLLLDLLLARDQRGAGLSDESRADLHDGVVELFGQLHLSAQTQQGRAQRPPRGLQLPRRALRLVVGGGDEYDFVPQQTQRRLFDQHDDPRLRPALLSLCAGGDAGRRTEILAQRL